MAAFFQKPKDRFGGSKKPFKSSVKPPQLGGGGPGGTSVQRQQGGKGAVGAALGDASGYGLSTNSRDAVEKATPFSSGNNDLFSKALANIKNSKGFFVGSNYVQPGVRKGKAQLDAFRVQREGDQKDYGLLQDVINAAADRDLRAGLGFLDRDTSILNTQAQTEASRANALLNAQTQAYQSQLQSETSRYNNELQSETSRHNAQLQADTSRANAELQAKTDLDIASGKPRNKQGLYGYWDGDGVYHQAVPLSLGVGI